MADPILRWAGGKRQIIDDIVTRLPPVSDINDYYEPFFGGGAVFFELEPKNGHINDINPTLINFYQQFRDNIDHIIVENNRLDDQITRYNTDEKMKEFYYTRRREFNELQNGCCDDKLREAVLFLFLNRTCFNGLYRTNGDGDFNVPMKSGIIKTESIKSNLKHGHQALQNTIITSKDFTFIKDEVGENDLVFLDPPYQQQSDARHFDEYQPGGFDKTRHKEVRDIALELHHRGAFVMITNSPAAEEIYTKHNEFYKNFRIKPIEATRSINSDSSQRAQLGDTDIIVTNSPQFWEQKDFGDFR